jgi:hypothetical protein
MSFRINVKDKKWITFNFLGPSVVGGVANSLGHVGRESGPGALPLMLIGLSQE